MTASGRYTAPCRDLHIYYLNGRLTSDGWLPGGDFLGNWEEEGYSFLFFSRPSGDIVARVLSAQPHLTLIDKYHMTYEQWQGGKVAPFSVGRFFISPPWEDVRPPGDDREWIHIELDPGVVFGTGTHPTTRDCLEAMASVFASAPVTSSLDLGTGTGVLALAAARLGCRRNLAVDVNYLACKTADANVRCNSLTERVMVIQGRAEDWVHRPADLLIANIHHDVMKRLIAAEGFFTKQWLILSGLLRSQARELTDRLAGRPVEIVRRWEHEGIWHTFLVKNTISF